MTELNLDDGLVREYLAECREHLATIENDLLAIEQTLWAMIRDDAAEADRERIDAAA